MWWIDWERHPLIRDGHEVPSWVHTTPAAFRRVLADFRALYLRQQNPLALADYVAEHSGERLSLGIPSNWFLELLPPDQLPELHDHLLGDLLCCEKVLIPLGRCLIVTTERVVRTDFVVFWGAHAAIYVYDLPRESLALAAPHLDHLARFGLLNSECLYRRPETPYATRSPPLAVERLLACRDLESCRWLVAELGGVDLNLRTPGQRACPLKLYGLTELARHCWPFLLLSDDDLYGLRINITLKLKCAWTALGGAGRYRCTGLFHVAFLIVVDRFLALYAVCVRTGELYRVADDFAFFFRAGLLKTRVRETFSHHLRRKAAVERRALCRHVRQQYPPPRHLRFEIGAFFNVERQYRWLCRPYRFRPNMLETWDDEDLRQLRRRSRLRREARENALGRRRPDGRDGAAGGGDEDDDDGPGPARGALHPLPGPPLPPPPPVDDDDDDDDEDDGFDSDPGISDDSDLSDPADLEEELLDLRILTEQIQLAEQYLAEPTVTLAEVETRRVRDGEGAETGVVFDFGSSLPQ
ncbi:T4 [Tupaiid betaherpesvirus 1]|uniref:T4 n=1 Tax=Tupaiid herpesvirus 1 (strain 1) TaxID=10397 RepID=Q91TV9_TUHV1|nr:T4 [Tupaiid betaherpesvirus 1]AAK57028.1 T4 [Tupaiid betaherpesvirus 1]